MDIHVKGTNDGAADVYALITYVDPKTGESETLWNARVSNAPETIPHRITGQKMYRVVGSIPAPDYTPQPGERVIQDMSLEVARDQARQIVTYKQDIPGLQAAMATFSSDADAMESYAQYLVSQAKAMVTEIDADWAPSSHQKIDPNSLTNMQKSFLSQTYRRAARAHVEHGDPRQRYGRILFSDREHNTIGFEQWQSLVSDPKYRTLAAETIGRRGDIEVQARVEWIGCHIGDDLIFAYGYYCFCHRCGEGNSLTAWFLGLFTNQSLVDKLLGEACADPRRANAVAALDGLPETCQHAIGESN